MKDFKGPDCRFVNFKKGEAVYVYYKLIGKSTELWAGSVSTAKLLFSLLFLAIYFCTRQKEKQLQEGVGFLP